MPPKIIFHCSQFLIAVLFFASWQLDAQNIDKQAIATITFANNQSVVANSDGRLFESVELQQGETIDVSVQFPIEKARHTLRIEPRDGGRITGPSDALVVADDGTISFQFQVGNSPGHYGVSLHDGAEEAGLQFYVP
jgi:hypothetical protein